MPPILVLDFDGVMHSYTSGWQGEDICNDEPVKGLEEFLRVAVQHFDVCIFSSRSSSWRGREAMIKWCFKWLLPELAERIRVPSDKPSAFLTLDDRALTFTGEWPDVEALLNFKPWNKV